MGRCLRGCSQGTDRAGFEPAVPLTRYAGLANRCLQPLGHLSRARRHEVAGQVNRCRCKANRCLRQDIGASSLRQRFRKEPRLVTSEYTDGMLIRFAWVIFWKESDLEPGTHDNEMALIVKFCQDNGVDLGEMYWGNENWGTVHAEFSRLVTEDPLLLHLDAEYKRLSPRRNDWFGGTKKELIRILEKREERRSGLLEDYCRLLQERSPKIQGG